MTGILSLKLFLVPGLIYAVTLAGRRWGLRDQPVAVAFSLALLYALVVQLTVKRLAA